MSAVECNVPQQRATIQIAVNDVTCTRIIVAPGTYYETVTIRRSLALQGSSGSTPKIAAQVQVLDPGVLVQINNIHIDTTGPAIRCFQEGLRADGGAQVDVVNVQVDNDGSAGVCSFFQLLFADDFETGNTSRWSLTNGRASTTLKSDGATSDSSVPIVSVAPVSDPR